MLPSSLLTIFSKYFYIPARNHLGPGNFLLLYVIPRRFLSPNSSLFFMENFIAIFTLLAAFCIPQTVAQISNLTFFEVNFTPKATISRASQPSSITCWSLNAFSLKLPSSFPMCRLTTRLRESRPQMCKHSGQPSSR